MHKLEVVVTEDCPSCETARRVAARVARRYPMLEVTVLDLDVPGVAIPERVFAVPTFCLDGAIVSLGTPDWNALCARIDAVLAVNQGVPIWPERPSS